MALKATVQQLVLSRTSIPLPFWPIASSQPVPDSFAPMRRMLDPISTDMEGGKTRERPRPGDNVGTITQTIWMSMAEHEGAKGLLPPSLALLSISVSIGPQVARKVVVVHVRPDVV